MAQTINLRENEYQMIVLELAKMHTEQLQSVADVIAEMRTLVTSDDVFSTNLTSKKVEDMLDTLSSDIMVLLEQAFQDSEAGVANMIKSVMATDGACG
ncbi:MAG: hypothetical protein HDQ99_03435 [Lachnospiraceae bacterium]|nr:hypothetical protein [Lachnospiraceae bacterium]